MKSIESILPQEQLPGDLHRRLLFFAETYCVRHESLYGYGWGHLLFACYAAFPAHLSPDLLHKIRLNFRHYSIFEKKTNSKLSPAEAKVKEGKTSEIHPIAVNDLLLSNLLRETGFERLEMPEELRHYLMWFLQKSGIFEEKLNISPLPPHETAKGKPGIVRLNGLAEFLRRYAAEHYTAPDPVTRSLREAQEWTADAWQYPERAAARIRQRLLEAQKPAEQYHFSRLNNRLGAQYQLQLNSTGKGAPASFQSLHHYTQGLVAMYNGKKTEAAASIANVQNRVQLKGLPAPSDSPTLRLPVLKEVVTELLKTNPELAFPPLGTKPRTWRSLEERLRSPYPKAVLAIGDGDRNAIAEALVRMEESLRREHDDPTLMLADYFDVVAGVGMGAFMAGMIAVGRGAEEISKEFPAGRRGSKRSAFPTNFDSKLRKFFGDTSFADLPSNGLVIAADSLEEKETRLTYNMLDIPSSERLVEHITYAVRSREAAENESLKESSFNHSGLFSATANPLFSLELSLTELLIECQTAYNWPVAPDRLMLVSMKALTGQEPDAQEDSDAQLNRYLAQDMRWLERHTLDLLRQHRMLYFDGMGEINWPREFEVAINIREEPSIGETASLSEDKPINITLPKPLSEIKNDLQGLLANNEIANAISILQDLLPSGGEKRTQTILLEGRLKQISRDHNIAGIISFDDYQLETARIINAMFKLIAEIEEKDFDTTSAVTTKQSPSSAVPKFVIIYDIADSEYCKMLNKHLNLLKIMKKIRVYNVNDVMSYESPIDRAKQEMVDADYLLVLITVNLFNSPDWFELVYNAMGEGRHIIPIRIEQADYEGTGLEKLESFPSNNRAVSQFKNPDHAYTDIVTGIRKLLTD